MFQTDLTHGASTYTVTAWLGKKSTGAFCALETTEQLKAYKTLEWPEKTCASGIYRTTEGKPQDRTVLNLLLYHFILRNHISKIYYTATLQLPWKRVLCQSEPAWRHEGIAARLRPESSGRIFELMFSCGTSRALGLNDSPIPTCATAALKGVHLLVVQPCAIPLSCSRSHCESLHPAPRPPSLTSQTTPSSPPLAGVHVASPDLLPVLAAGQLGRLKPLLHCHEPLLNAAAALLCAVRPTRPRPHFTPCEGIKSEEILEGQKTRLWTFGLSVSRG